MKKIYNCIFSLFTIILLQILYFLWQPFPKSMLKTWGMPLAWQDIVTDIIYFLLFFCIYTFAYISVAQPGTSAKASRRSRLKVMYILFVVHIGLSLIMFLASNLGYECYWPVCQISTLLFWIVAEFLLPGLIERPGKESGFDRRIAIVWFLVGGLAAILTVFEFNSGNTLARLSQRYTSDSTFFNAHQANMIWNFQIRNMLLDLTCAGACLAYPLVYGRRDEKDYGQWSRMMVRGMLLVILLVPLYICKAIFIPNNIFIMPPVLDYHTKRIVNMEAEERFDTANEYDTEFTRAEYPFGEVVYYSATRIDVWYNGEVLFDHTLEGRLTGENKSENKMEMMGYQNIELSNAHAAVFASQLIVWVDDAGVMEYIEFEELAKYSEDSVLIQLCRKRIAYGDMRFFDYGYEYLLRFDPEFILPYIERYAAGDFTQRELEYSCDYRPEYIQSLATNVISRS